MLTSWLQPTLEQWWHLHQQQRLHHALLVAGPAGIGKAALIQALAHRLLCQSANAPCGQCKSCHLFLAGHHPDFLQLTVENSIGVDAVREIAVFFQQSAQQGGVKLVSVPQAHKMTEAASNALLKTLEEPGNGCFLLLQTDHPQRLLPTILSRCQQWSIAAPSLPEAKQFLRLQTNENLPAELLTLSAGAPYLVYDWWRQGQVPLILDGLALLRDMLQHPAQITNKVTKLESLPLLPELIRFVLFERLAHAQQGLQFEAIERFDQWCRDCALILGQNKSIALAALMYDLAKFTR
ncbi:MAG TPA: DNA polymerase III subunit delta' [Rheinheimera sp.]|nr:DNA polymerase III subunit delta' [Rheinheimera sp.]